MSITVMKQARRALHIGTIEDVIAARDALDKAIADAQKQEPVACVVQHGATVKLEWASVQAAHNAKAGPLYTKEQL